MERCTVISDRAELKPSSGEFDLHDFNKIQIARSPMPKARTFATCFARSDDIYSMSDPSSSNRLILRIEIPYDSRSSESDARPDNGCRRTARAAAYALAAAILKSLAPDRVEAQPGGTHDLAGIGSRNRKPNRLLAGILRILGAERVGLHEHHEPADGEILAAHFLGRARGIAGDRLLHLPPRRHQPAERSRGHDAFAGRRRVFERDAGNAAQLKRGAFKRDAEPLADEAGIRLLEGKRRGDADIREPAARAARRCPRYR